MLEVILATAVLAEILLVPAGVVPVAGAVVAIRQAVVVLAFMGKALAELLLARAAPAAAALRDVLAQIMAVVRRILAAQAAAVLYASFGASAVCAARRLSLLPMWGHKQ